MLPSQFLELYGQVVIRAGESLSLAPGSFFRGLPNPDRYLLCINCISGSAAIWWDSEATAADPFHQVLIAPETREIVHALHGAWVNTGYTVRFDVPGTALSIIEGFMRPDNFKRRDNGKATTYKNGVSADRRTVPTPTSGKRRPSGR